MVSDQNDLFVLLDYKILQHGREAEKCNGPCLGFTDINCYHAWNKAAFCSK